jgi:LacI family transcriptional regulator
MAELLNNKKNRRPSMKDVAELAGVSRTTVSFVINEVPHTNIPAETQERVWTAIEQLGYRPNAIAKGLRTRKSGVIGFITDEIATTPFAVDIIKGAQHAALANDKVLLLVDTEGDLEVEKDVFEMMNDWQVEGIVFATSYHRVVNPAVNLHAMRAVLVDCYIEDHSLPSVVPDEVQGGRLATETLLQKGHRRIGFINGPVHFPASAGRLQGYKQALTAYEVPFDESLLRFGDWWQESGYAYAKELLALPNPPSAIFCAADFMAMGAYDAIKEVGLSIPKDIAVIGFDNREIVAAHLRPPLTTIALPYYEMGRWAVEYLVKHEEQDLPLAPIQEMLECPLVERQSL